MTTSNQLDLLQEIKDLSRAYWALAQLSRSSSSQALYSEESIGSPDSFPVVGSILAGVPEPFNGIKEEESEDQWMGTMSDLYRPPEGSIDRMLRYSFEGSYAQSSFQNQSI
jgi:hypothetical protein